MVSVCPPLQVPLMTSQHIVSGPAESQSQGSVDAGGATLDHTKRPLFVTLGQSLALALPKDRPLWSIH